SHAPSVGMASNGQSSRTPYNHLRYTYPETWKQLVKMMEDDGAPVAAHSDGTLVRTKSGFRLEGSHLGPSLPVIMSISKSSSDPALTRWRDQEKASVHAVRREVGKVRNPFGGWYEGNRVVEKIGGAATFNAEDP
ncbi:unnamed protein product, partial [Polarella glacialis]